MLDNSSVIRFVASSFSSDLNRLALLFSPASVVRSIVFSHFMKLLSETANTFRVDRQKSIPRVASLSVIWLHLLFTRTTSKPTCSRTVFNHSRNCALLFSTEFHYNIRDCRVTQLAIFLFLEANEIYCLPDISFLLQ